MTVISVTQTARTADTYNLTVTDAHTFYVGEDGAWVHNVDCTGNAVVDKYTGSKPLTITDRLGNEIVIDAADIAKRNPKMMPNGNMIDDHGFVYSKKTDGSVSSRVANADEISSSGIQLDYKTISTANPNKTPPQSATPRNQAERNAFDHVKANPEKGKPITRELDTRFTSGGFQKLEQKITGPSGKNISIHYQYNSVTRKVVDVKVVSPI